MTNKGFKNLQQLSPWRHLGMVPRRIQLKSVHYDHKIATKALHTTTYINIRQNWHYCQNNAPDHLLAHLHAMWLQFITFSYNYKTLSGLFHWFSKCDSCIALLWNIYSKVWKPLWDIDLEQGVPIRRDQQKPSHDSPCLFVLFLASWQQPVAVANTRMQLYRHHSWGRWYHSLSSSQTEML